MQTFKQASLLTNIFKALAVFFAIIPLFFACKKNDTQAPDLGYDYFPTEIGKYVVYDVDSFVYNKFSGTVDTFRFQIKEVNESAYLDNAGRSALRIERYKKKYSKTIPYSSMNWTLQDVWNATRTNTAAEKTEENIKYVKLSFPIEKSKTWNGNAFNTIGERNYKFTDIDKKRTIGGIVFDSTTLVTQYNKSDLLNTDYYIEIFAKNHGMVYKEITTRQYDSINAFPTGMIYKMTVNSVGP